MIVFVSGSDTNVGKTFYVGLLAKMYIEKGKKVITCKPVETGIQSEKESDLKIHTKIATIPHFNTTEKKLLQQYSFKEPISPHLAEKKTKTTIKVEKSIEAIKSLEKKFDVVIVEGAGGFFSPINSDTLWIDFALALKCQNHVVIPNKLGTISQTIAIIYALQVKGLSPEKVILNNFFLENNEIKESNKIFIKKKIHSLKLSTKVEEIETFLFNS